ncbi:hypothetical protein ACQPUY_05900 [Clostridium nigeriense]|uniref:hypothetical protein n=1 Tax=Clostridium nigeriense TaxID=1805470 RepID=UPI003D34EF08
MNIRIICWNIKNKFRVDDGIELLNRKECLDRKIYYQFLDKKVEIIIFEGSNLNKINIKNKEGKIIILVEELDDNKFNQINEVFKNNFLKILVGKDSLSDNRNGIGYFPQLLNKDDEINICALLYMLTNEKVFFYNFNKPHIIVGEYGENNKDEIIPIFILKRFSNFTKLKNFSLNLHVTEELNLKEISYIEDGLIEYIDFDGKIKINQFISDKKTNNIFFYLIANQKNI